MGCRSRFDPGMPSLLGVGRLACGLFIVGSLSCSSLMGSWLCSPGRCSRTWFPLSSRFALRVAAACLSGASYVPQPGRARCVVLVRWRLCAGGQPVWVACWPVWARPAVSGRCSCPYVACFPSEMLFRGVPNFGDVRVCGCCVVGITVVGTSSSAPPNGRLVPLLDALGPGSRVGSVPVVPVAWRRYSTLWWCAAPSWGGVSSGEKSFQILYDTPCPALEASSHAQFLTWYFAVSFGPPLQCACADHMHTPVGGKTPPVPLGASPCSPWEPQGAAPARCCGAHARVCLPVVCRIVPCLAGSVAGVSMPQCGVRKLGWLGWCSGV